MSADVYTSLALLLDADNELRPSAHGDGGKVLGLVEFGSYGHIRIQSSDPAALRKLAAALVEAADKMDRLAAVAS